MTASNHFNKMFDQVSNARKIKGSYRRELLIGRPTPAELDYQDVLVRHTVHSMSTTPVYHEIHWGTFTLVQIILGQDTDACANDQF